MSFRFWWTTWKVIPTRSTICIVVTLRKATCQCPGNLRGTPSGDCMPKLSWPERRCLWAVNLLAFENGDRVNSDKGYSFTNKLSLTAFLQTFRSVFFVSSRFLTTASVANFAAWVWPFGTFGHLPRLQWEQRSAASLAFEWNEYQVTRAKTRPQRAFSVPFLHSLQRETKWEDEHNFINPVRNA